MAAEVYVHPNALNESESVGAGTRIWAFAHVMKGAVVGKNCNIGDHAFVEAGAVLGDGVTVKNGVALWEGVKLENYVFVGPNAVFTNDMFPRSIRNPAIGDRYSNKENWLLETRLREGSSIGANATIVCGVTIGQYALVGAGAVVIRDVPDHAMVVGSPARQIGFVCICGLALPSDTLCCDGCRRSYMKADDSLALKNEGAGE